MAIAIFGGRFDPPHLGHYWVARQILDYRRDIEKVILIPAFQHQWKPAVATGQERLDMLQVIASQTIKVSDIELIRQGVSYSIDTIRAIKEKTKEKVYWIVGSDILGEFAKWEKADELIREATFLVFPRDPYHLPQSLPKGFEVIGEKSIITSNFSSTVIRERIKKDLSITDFVPEGVESYIQAKGLYK